MSAARTQRSDAALRADIDETLRLVRLGRTPPTFIYPVADEAERRRALALLRGRPGNGAFIVAIEETTT